MRLFVCSKSTKERNHPSMKKLFAVCLSALLCIVPLSACAPSGSPVSVGSSAGSSVSSSATTSSALSESAGDTSRSVVAGEAHYPITISSYDAHKETFDFTYEKAPERVVCLWANSVENMLALGLGERILLAGGVTEEEILPEWKAEFAKVKESQPKWPSKEDVVALQPDFILAWYSTFSDDKYWGDNAFWNERGIGTYISRNSGVVSDQTLQNEYNDLLTLGRIFDVEERAKALVSEMQAKVEKGRKAAQGKSPVRVLILENEKDAFRNYGETSIGGSIATQIGAELCEKDKSKRLSAEDVVAANPEMIFAVYFGDAIGKDQCVKDFTENPAFASVDAVKNGKVYPIDLSLIYCPGVRVSNSIDFFLQSLYPDLL